MAVRNDPGWLQSRISEICRLSMRLDQSDKLSSVPGVCLFGAQDGVLPQALAGFSKRTLGLPLQRFQLQAPTNGWEFAWFCAGHIAFVRAKVDKSFRDIAKYMAFHNGLTCSVTDHSSLATGQLYNLVARVAGVTLTCRGVYSQL